MIFNEGIICTISGKKFNVFEPHESMIDIEDIAHSLALQCRFTGHTKWHYSVARHSIKASFIVSDHLKLAALLHDASEAYLCDLARPVKHTDFAREYREIEAKVSAVIAKKFGLNTDAFEHQEIKHADNVLLATEIRDVTNFESKHRAHLPEPLAEPIVRSNQSFEYWRDLFMECFHAYQP